MQVPGTAVIWADFAHIRTVKGRKVCEMIIEAPLEDLLEILKRLGNPVGADMIPVAIAPIDPAAVKAALDIKPVDPIDKRFPNGITPQKTPLTDKLQAERSEGGSPKPFSTLPLSQQAAIRCNDKDFIRFLDDAGIASEFPDDWDPADVVRKYCSIASRTELDRQTNEYSARRGAWLMLEDLFQSWLTDQKYAGSKR